MLVLRALGATALLAAILAVGCSSLLGADPTPVPGAAATLTRSSRTPIPTPVRTPNASPSVEAVASRVAAAASPSPAGGASRPVSDAEVDGVEHQIAQALAGAQLPGLEDLLLDHVSLSTPEGGQVMDRAQVAAWLRDHAGSGMRVERVDRSTQTVTLEVLTDGWPTSAPFQQGQVSLSLRRYDANGRLDEDNGDWKVDVVTIL